MTPRHIVAIGGSDAGISAALRARELDPTTDVTVIVADAYPNFSICGIPYYVSGEVTHWTNLAHRTAADLAATGMRVLTDTRATAINVKGHSLDVLDSTGAPQQLSYDALIVGTGAISARPPFRGLSGPDALGPADGVHLLHSMGDTFAVMDSLQECNPATAVIVGAGYIGLEMAEALTSRGIHVTQIEALPEVLPTVDPELGALVHAELERHGVEVLTDTAVTAISRTDTGALTVTASHAGQPVSRTVDFVLVVVGVRPDTELAADAGAHLGVKGAIVVDEAMRTNLPDIFAAGDCVHTHHRLLGITWLPLGTTAHKQGRVAGENALGGHARFAGSLGTQVVKVFDLVAARTGLREHEALGANLSWTPPPANRVPTTTRPTTQAPPPSTSASPATSTAVASSAPNSSGTAAPKSPNASTPMPPRSSTKCPSTASTSSTSPTPRHSGRRGTPSKSQPKHGYANTQPATARPLTA